MAGLSGDVQFGFHQRVGELLFLGQGLFVGVVGVVGGGVLFVAVRRGRAGGREEITVEVLFDGLVLTLMMKMVVG